MSQTREVIKEGTYTDEEFEKEARELGALLKERDLEKAKMFMCAVDQGNGSFGAFMQGDKATMAGYLHALLQNVGDDVSSAVMNRFAQERLKEILRGSDADEDEGEDEPESEVNSATAQEIMSEIEQEMRREAMKADAEESKGEQDTTEEGAAK